jgi:hypothetical protein
MAVGMGNNGDGDEARVFDDEESSSVWVTEVIVWPTVGLAILVLLAMALVVLVLWACGAVVVPWLR